MKDLELKKRLAHLYKPSAKFPSLVDVAPMRFLMLDGEGDIGGPTFQDAVASLYGLAYPVKFAAKKQLDVTYAVMPLEGLYWRADGAPFLPDDVHSLAWQLQILLPDEVSAEFVDTIRSKVAAKKALPRLGDIRVQTFSEGRSVQILHVGPYGAETPTVARLLAFAAEKGLRVAGKHHEIYLGDPAKTAPEKLKTVLRYPVR